MPSHPTKARIILTDCVSCKRETNQLVLSSKKTSNGNEKVETEENFTEYMILECGGCKTISFLIRETTEHVSFGETYCYDRNYPKKIDSYEEYKFLRDEDHEQLPVKIYELYNEVRVAFENEVSVLAGLGLRTIIEAICLQQKISGNSLFNKIKTLETKSLISPNERELLDKLRVIGNMSAHEIKAFPMDKLGYALDIVNHVLQSVYILPKINKKLNIKPKSR